MTRYLTKSRFKLACDCETRLYYTRKKEYADQSAEDPFLVELAKGGYQVGELAKYYFTADAADITVEEIGYEESLAETQRRIERGDRYIAEAAVRFEKLFIRVDIFEIDTSSKQIKLYEVKSKSWDSGAEFLKMGTRGEKKGKRYLDSGWAPYLKDIAFQKYVVEKAYPGYQVNAFLTLVNKEARTSVDGLNQLFKVKTEGKGHRIIVDENISGERLGEPVLENVPVDEAIDFIREEPVDSPNFPGFRFDEYLKVLADAYDEDRKLSTPLSKDCKSCPFYTRPEDEGLKSGMAECWMEQLGIGEERYAAPKVIEIWGGKSGSVSIPQKMINRNKYFMDEVEKEDISDDIPDRAEGELTAHQRRWEQIRRVKENKEGFYLDTDGLNEEMNRWKYPLHFIDFETSSPALPFTKDAYPYEGIAFQYSHHRVSKKPDGSYTIHHKNQFLKTDRGINPNLDFIRELKKDLSEDEGTIFRYHNHENTYLRHIYSQLGDMPDATVPDKKELMDFIDSITFYKDGRTRIEGPRSMVDMYDLVLRFYYSLHAGGSNSLKQILPAAIHDSRMLKEKYSQPVCGENREVSSLNFSGKVWLREETHFDPYKELPPVFEDYSREELDDMFADMDELADGGAAMMAFAKLQFFDTDPEQREAIRQALFQYCELDTLAMVMLWEFWNEQLNLRN